MNEQTIQLDISKRPAVAPTIYLRQGDKSSTVLHVEVYKNGEPFAVGEYNVKFCMRAPKDMGYYEVDGTASGIVATFTIDETYAGNFAGTTDIAYVEILEGETVIASTASFRVVILENAMEGVEPETAWTNGVEQFLEDAQDTLDAAAARAIAAAEAAEGVVIDAIPTMTANVKGGAKLGNGLRVDDDALSVGNLVQSGSGAEVVTDGCAIYSVDGEGWAEQDGTPTPENPVPIVVVHGRNLLNLQGRTESGLTFTIDDDGKCTVTGTATRNGWIVINIGTLSEGTYYFTSSGSTAFKLLKGYADLGYNRVFTVDDDTVTYRIGISAVDGTIYNESAYFQLELGTTPTPYVPYGYIGLDVYDSQGAHVSTTPIPLPSKGFAASLPDGTADALAIDSAGRWEWTNEIGEHTVDGSSLSQVSNNDYLRVELTLTTEYMRIGGPAICDICRYSESIGTNVLFTRSQTVPQLFLSYEDFPTLNDFKDYCAANPFQLFYRLRVTTTESGYIDLPDLPEGATVSIPELREIGVSWFVQGVDELAKHAGNWGKRAAENESRIAALEQAVAELATS